MRCQAMTTTGRSCREQRPEWLWLVQQGDTLRYRCTSHLRVSDRVFRVRVSAMRNWLARGGASL